MIAKLPERFLDRVAFEPNTGCWLWTGALSEGYGSFRTDGGRTIGAHRYAYEVVRGPIPVGLQLDHFKCDTRSCANPFHVRPVTPRENVLRGRGPTALHASKTHCKAGHPLTPDNVYISQKGRECRMCGRARWRRLRQRKKAAAS